jgi:hypothetical protein
MTTSEAQQGYGQQKLPQGQGSQGQQQPYPPQAISVQELEEMGFVDWLNMMKEDPEFFRRYCLSASTKSWIDPLAGAAKGLLGFEVGGQGPPQQGQGYGQRQGPPQAISVQELQELGFMDWVRKTEQESTRRFFQKPSKEFIDYLNSHARRPPVLRGFEAGGQGYGQEMSIWPQLEQLKQAINAAIQQGKLLFTDAMNLIKPLEDAASGTLPKEQLGQYISLLERAQSGQQISQQELEEMGVVSWLKKIYPPDLFNAMLSTLR